MAMLGLPLDRTRAELSLRVIPEALCTQDQSNAPNVHFRTTDCHGRLLRWGETSTQDPRSRLNLRWEISLSIGSAMATQGEGKNIR